MLPFIVITVYLQIYATVHGQLGDLGLRAYLQDEVVSRVPCHRKENVRAGFGSPTVPVHLLLRYL